MTDSTQRETTFQTILRIKFEWIHQDENGVITLKGPQPFLSVNQETLLLQLEVNLQETIQIELVDQNKALSIPYLTFDALWSQSLDNFRTTHHSLRDRICIVHDALQRSFGDQFRVSLLNLKTSSQTSEVPK